MNKPKPLLASEWEVLREQLKSEKNVMKALQEHYDEALKGVDTRIAELLGRGDANLPHVIRRVEYQKMIRAQITAALELLHAKEYETISEYLNECYTDAFVGSVYTLHAQDMPVIIPIDQSAAVKAVTIDSKLKSDLYSSLGVDITELKKTIAAEITRGIASGMLYSDMVRNIANAGKGPLSRARTIVRTEAGRVQEQATFDAAKGAKAVGADVVKQWSAILDGKTRDNHRRLDGQIREIDEPFEIDGHKAMHPHDFGRPEEDINCRCTMLTRARAALDESELKRLREKAVRHSLYMDDPKAFRAEKLPALKNFTEFKKAYLKAAETVEKQGKSGIIKKGNTEVRKWYLDSVSNIPDTIDPSLPMIEKAQKAFEARNRIRTEARNMMADEATRKMLDQERPNKTFEELVKSKMERKGMTREEAIEDIYKTATKTNANVNKEFGLEDE